MAQVSKEIITRQKIEALLIAR